MDQLKRFLGLIDGEPAPTTDTGPDRLPLRNDSPLAAEHALLTKLFEQAMMQSDYYSPRFADLRTWPGIAALPDSAKGRVVLAAAERAVNAKLSSIRRDEHDVIKARYAASRAVDALLTQPFKLDRAGLFDLLLFVSAWGHNFATIPQLMQSLMTQVEAEAASASLDEGERYVLYLLRAAMIVTPPMGIADEQVQRLTRLIGDDARIYLVPGEAWSDAINQDVTQQSGHDRENWAELLRHCSSAAPPQRGRATNGSKKRPYSLMRRARSRCSSTCSNGCRS